MPKTATNRLPRNTKPLANTAIEFLSTCPEESRLSIATAAWTIVKNYASKTTGSKGVRTTTTRGAKKRTKAKSTTKTGRTRGRTPRALAQSTQTANSMPA
jgi:hypothetical protein